jgi:hypothetical protein
MQPSHDQAKDMEKRFRCSGVARSSISSWGILCTVNSRPRASLTTKLGALSRNQASLVVISTTRTEGGNRRRALESCAAEAQTVTGSLSAMAVADQRVLAERTQARGEGAHQVLPGGQGIVERNPQAVAAASRARPACSK